MLYHMGRYVHFVLLSVILCPSCCRSSIRLSRTSFTNSPFLSSCVDRATVSVSPNPQGCIGLPASPFSYFLPSILPLSSPFPRSDNKYAHINSMMGFPSSSSSLCLIRRWRRGPPSFMRDRRSSFFVCPAPSQRICVPPRHRCTVILGRAALHTYKVCRGTLTSGRRSDA